LIVPMIVWVTGAGEDRGEDPREVTGILSFAARSSILVGVRQVCARFDAEDRGDGGLLAAGGSVAWAAAARAMSEADHAKFDTYRGAAHERPAREVLDVPVTECLRCHQPVDHRPLSTVEMLTHVAAALEAAYDRDPWRVVEVLAARGPGSAQRAAGRRVVPTPVGDAGRSGSGAAPGGAQLHAQIEVERLDELWGEPAAGEDR
jgi:hypothetical protein